MQYLKTSFLLLTYTAMVFSGSPRLVPGIVAVAIDSKSHTRLEGVQVTMLVKRNLMSSYREVASTVTNSDGVCSFPEYRGKKINWVGLSFSWKPANAPERHMLFEAKLQKGLKSTTGYQMTPKTTYASFELEGFYTSRCVNLFGLETTEKGLEITFQVPQSYAECEYPVKKRTHLSQIGTRDLNKGNLNYFKFKKDIEMGAQFYRSMKETPENQPLQDTQVVNYIGNMVHRLVKASDMPDLEFTVTVLDADVMNAFALPGGFIFVYRGLIEQTESEGELAGVLAHEIAHVTSRHGTEGVTSAINKMLLATTLGEIAAYNMKGDDQWLIELARIAIFSGTQFWVIGGTRKREAEADYLGVQYSWKAGYDPNGMATLFGRWAEQRENSQTRLDQFFSDHPNDMNRVKSISEQTGYFIPPDHLGVASSPEYLQVKERLRQLPRPKATGQAAANSIFNSFKQGNEKVILETMEEYFSNESTK